MEPEKIKSEIKKLSVPQKLLLAQDIWDLIAEENDKLIMPEWQKTELKKRYKYYMRDEMGTHDWQEIHEGIRKKNR